VAGEETLATSGGKRGTAAMLFLGGVYVSLDAMSTLNSSPWTAESFGGDPEKEDSLKEYVCHALGVSTALSLLSGSIAGQGLWWSPVLGTLLVNAYLFFLYMRAIRRARERGSTDWKT
jgi:hypothetical protein